MARVRAAAQRQLQAIDERITENRALHPEDRALIIETARSALSASGQSIADEVGDGADA